MEKTKRLFELDVLRGIAALGVVLYHYTTWYDEKFGHAQTLLFNFPKGKYGVELFFIISGFVIFLSLSRIQSSLDFVIGRFSRLYPAYWVAVLLTFSVISLAGMPQFQVSWQEAIANLTMLQVLLDIPSIDPVYWTLQLELFFYLIMLVLYETRLLKYINLLSVIWLLVMVVTIALEYYGIAILPEKFKAIFLLSRPNSFIYANLFIVGMMLYKIYRTGASVPRYAIIAAGLLVYKLEHSWAETIITFAFVLLFHGIFQGYFVWLNQRVLIFLGTISYTLYLVHQNIGYVVIYNLYKVEMNPNLSVAIATVISLLLACLITFLVEKPAMQLIRHYYKRIALKQA
jgi:peptidoglycan/LPS O-acetylase OafA/YrhL